MNYIAILEQLTNIKIDEFDGLDFIEDFHEKVLPLKNNKI